MDTTQHPVTRTQSPAAAIPTPSRRWLGYGLVLLAGTLWACLGLFFRALQRYDLPPTAVALNRAAISGLTLFGVLALRRPGSRSRVTLRLRRRDLPYFAFYAFGVSAFFMIYIEAVNRGSVALASVLLYTAPVWVVLFARLRWREPLTPAKLTALGLAVAGSALVAVGGGFGDSSGANPLAIALGLLSGVAYAAYSLLSNEGLRRGYDPAAMVMYVMLGGALFLLPFQDWQAVGRALATPAAWPALLGVAWLSSLLAPVCYAAGQQRVGASTASILATVEPAFAALLAWLILGEPLAPPQLLGGGCILAAVIVLARRGRSLPDQAPAGDGRPGAAW